MEMHMFVLRELAKRKGFAQVQHRHHLSTVMKITSKKRHPDLITFKFGSSKDDSIEVTHTLRFLIPNAQKATKKIKDRILKVMGEWLFNLLKCCGIETLWLRHVNETAVKFGTMLNLGFLIKLFRSVNVEPFDTSFPGPSLSVILFLLCPEALSKTLCWRLTYLCTFQIIPNSASALEYWLYQGVWKALIFVHC